MADLRSLKPGNQVVILEQWNSARRVMQATVTRIGRKYIHTNRAFGPFDLATGQEKTKYGCPALLFPSPESCKAFEDSYRLRMETGKLMIDAVHNGGHLDDGELRAIAAILKAAEARRAA